MQTRGKGDRMCDRRLAAEAIVASSCAARKTRKLHGGVRSTANIPISTSSAVWWERGSIEPTCSTRKCQQVVCVRDANPRKTTGGERQGDKGVKWVGIGQEKWTKTTRDSAEDLVWRATELPHMHMQHTCGGW
jgi:hypothetical protein